MPHRRSEKNVSLPPLSGKKSMMSMGILRNVTAGFGQFLLRFVLGIWFTRFLIHSIGVELYGLVPLAWSITQYFSLITLIINTASGRYLIIEISKGDGYAANKVFNTVFWSVTALSAIVLVCGVIISWSSPLLFKIPLSHESDARIIFFSVSIAFVLSMFGNPFSLSTFATNKLYLGSFSEALQLIVRVGTAVFFIMLMGWQLGAVSLGIVAAGIVGLVVAVVIWRSVTPQLHVDRKSVDMRLLREMTGIGGWGIIDQVGGLLLLNSELIVVNLLYGSEATGKYGALLIISTIIRTIAQLMSSSVSPSIMDRYARGESEGVVRVICSSTRIIGIVMALPIGIVCGLAAPIMRMWLGEGYASLAPILVILCAHLCINTTILPLFPAQLMLKKVKVPAIATCATGVISILLAIFLGHPRLNLGLTGIALAAAAGFTLRNFLFTFPYGAHILDRKVSIFVPTFYTALGGFLVVIGLAWVATHVTTIKSLTDLGTIMVCIMLLYGLFSWFVLLKPDDKKWLMSFVPQFARIR